MIYTSSIIDGFKVIIGTCPIHMAMLCTLLIAIRIPRDENGERNDTATVLYLMMVVNHIFLVTVGFFNHFLHKNNHVLIAQMNVIALCAALLIMMALASHWIFADHILG